MDPLPVDLFNPADLLYNYLVYVFTCTQREQWKYDIFMAVIIDCSEKQKDKCDC